MYGFALAGAGLMCSATYLAFAGAAGWTAGDDGAGVIFGLATTWAAF